MDYHHVLLRPAEDSVILTPNAPHDVYEVEVSGHKGLWFEPGELYSAPSTANEVWLANNMQTSRDDVAKGKVWPTSSRYFNKRTMNAVYLLKILQHDCLFYRPYRQLKWCLDFVDFVDSGPVLCQTIPCQPGIPALFKQTTTNASLQVVFISLERLYHPACTKALISVDEQTWSTLLSKSDILPSFLEMLHSNTGGCMGHLSFLNPNSSTSVLKDSTFHLAAKFGNWAWEEGAVYVRHDFTTGKTLALFAGTSCYSTSRDFCKPFQHCSDLNLPEIILWFSQRRLVLVEQQRWSADAMTQELETRNGLYTNTSATTPRVELRDLSYTQDLTVTHDSLSCLTRACEETEIVLETLAVQIARYSNVLKQVGDTTTITTAGWAAIEDALQLQIQLCRTQATQTAGLVARVRSQVDSIKAMTSQRDRQLNIEIATATKRDSQLMRGIAFVTLVFLPATCISTFFSMNFFHLGSDGLLDITVSPTIWMYVVVTLATSTVLAIWYHVWSRRFRRGNSALSVDVGV